MSRRSLSEAMLIKVANGSGRVQVPWSVGADQYESRSDDDENSERSQPAGVVAFGVFIDANISGNATEEHDQNADKSSQNLHAPHALRIPVGQQEFAGNLRGQFQVHLDDKGIADHRIARAF